MNIKIEPHKWQANYINHHIIIYKSKFIRIERRHFLKHFNFQRDDFTEDSRAGPTYHQIMILAASRVKNTVNVLNFVFP